MRYIDADKLIEHLQDNLRECGNPDMATKPITYGCSLGIKGALSCAEALLTADVVEVRHGEWLKTESYPHRVYCSCCLKNYVTNEEIIQGRSWQSSVYCTEAEYCPRCGAKMDGGVTE